MEQDHNQKSQQDPTDHTPVVLTESPVAGEVKQDRRMSDEWGSSQSTS